MATRGNYSDFLQALAERESNDRASFVSDKGFLGKYQFAEVALQSIGYYGGDATPGVQDYSGQWLGRNGINSTVDFLNNEDVQDSAIREYHPVQWREITKFGDNVYAGQVIDGVRLTASGLLAGAYLVGSDGLNAFLQSGGANRPRDPFGTQITEYIDTFNDYRLPASFKTGLGGDNVISGGGGADELGGNGGNDTIDGGAGNDTAVFRHERSRYEINENPDGSITVRQTGGDRVDGTDRLIDIEIIKFSNGTLSVNNLDEIIPNNPPVNRVGTNSNDVLRGTNGNDTIDGRGGNDLVDGLGGRDILLGGQGEDTVNGGGGNDSLSGDLNADRMSGGQGNDFISGGRGADTIEGNDGNDQLRGRDGRDLLEGNGGNDELRGYFGADIVRGGRGDDGVNGGAGKDSINGGVGRDVLVGGADEDSFNFIDGFDFDVIRDYEVGVDVVNLSKVSGVNSLSDLSRGASAEGFLQVTIAGQGAIEFTNIAASDFNRIDFIL